MNWNVDFDELIPFIGKTIYRAENVLVEMCANSYDADASEVKITSHADSQQIIIQDNGSGMDGDDLKELVTIAKSKKKEMVENNRLTPEYNRKVLGSFGIGIISFFALGDSIKIFTKKKGKKALFIEIKKEYENGKLKRITVSDPLEKDEYENHLLNQEKGTTIEIHNNKLALSDNYYYRLVRFKLSNLPVSQNFKIELNGVGVNKDDFNGVDWVTKTFDFTFVSSPFFRAS